MKTTLEIPDAVLRRAKAQAAWEGIPLRQLITDAIREKLDAGRAKSKPWMKLAGQLKHLKSETARINRLIEREFETLDSLH